MSIWSDWAQRNFGPSRARRIKSDNRAARRSGRTRAKWSFERLEGRCMLAVTSNFLAGTLTINLSGADTVALSAAGGNVQLSINGIGGFNPDSGVLQASNVSSIVVTGTGNFANTIDLTGVIASDYSALLAVSLNGGDGSDTYKIDQSILPAAAVVTVADTGLSGTDSLQLTSTGPGPETIGISDVSVSRSSGPAVGYSGLEQLTVNGTNAGDTINVTKTNANTATIVNAGSGLDTFGAIDLTQIGAAGLTLHAGGNGESLTLNTTTAGAVAVNGAAVQRSGNGPVNYDGLSSLNINGSSGADTFQVSSTSTPTTLDGKDGGDTYTITHTALAATLNVSDSGASGSDQLTDSSTAPGPETIGLSDTQVTRSGGSATLTYSGLEQLTVNGTNAGNTINVTKTNANTATIVNAGSGLDTFGAIDLTQIGAAGLTLHAGGNGESLTLNTTTAGAVAVNGAAVQRSGNGPVNYDGLSSLNINGSSGADTFQVSSTSTPTTLDGKDGGDTYTITHTALAATLNVSDSGASGSDQLTDSSTAPGPETIGLSDTQVTRSGGSATLTYSGLEQLTVNGTNAGNTINVTKTNANTATIVNAGSGLDTFGAIDLTQIGAAGLTLHAGGNGESLTLNTTTAGAVAVNGAAVQRSGNGPVNYDGLSSLNINGSSGADTFQVSSTSTPTTLDGKDGGDTYTITHTALAATLNVSDSGASGSDQLTDSSTAPGPETIGLSDTQVTRSGGSATLTYSGLEQLTVNGTNAGNTINVTKTNANTATIVNAGSGLDTFGAIDLTQIGAAGLTLHAGGNGESLTLNTTTAGAVAVNGAAVQRSGNGPVNYDGLSSLNINGSSGADTFQVSSTSTPTTLDGKDGGDTYTITHTALAATLNVSDSGASGSDQLTDSSTAPGPETIGLSDTQVTRSGGSATLTYSGFEQLTVNGTNAGNTINVTKTNANTATIVNAGSGLDTFGAIDLTQIGAAGLTLHAGGNGESLTLNTTTAGAVAVNGAAVQRSGNGPVNYDGLSSLNINGSSGADTFQVSSTSTPTTLDGKDGGDTYTITHTALAATLNVSDSGASGSDQLTDSSTAPGPETIGLSDTQVTRSGGSATLTYSGLEQLTVNGTNAGNTINVTKTNANTATIVNAGSGLDTFGAIDLTQIGAAGLTLHAGGNGESLTLNTTTAGAVAVNGAAVQRSGNGPVNYDGLSSLNINGSSGADTFQVSSTSTPTTLDGKDGGDTYTITHTALAATLNVSDSGASGSDQLTDSSTAPGPETIGLSDTQVTRSGGSATLTYSGLEQLTVNGTNAGDTINVTGTASGTITTVDGKAGGDTYNVTQSGMAGSLFVTDSVVGGANQLTSSTAAAGPETISLTNSQITRTGAAAITYSGIQVVTVNGSASDDTMNVLSTINGTTTVNAGSGNDTITVGNASHKLDDIQGSLTINGNDNVAPPAGGDTLILDDSGQTTGQKYTLTDDQVTRLNGPVVTFGTIETLQVNSGSANDKFIVNFTAYPHNPAMTVKFNFGESLHAVKDDLQINGTAGNDTILVGVTNSVLGEQFLLNDIDCLQMFGNAGNDVLVNDTDVSSLIDGGTGSDVLVGGSNTDVIFGGSQLAGQHDKDLLYGRGGNDFLFADYDYNAGQPKVLHQTKNNDQVFGDDAPSPAVAALYDLPTFAPGAPGIDTIVIIGSDLVSAGGQVGDTIIGSGFQQLTVIDWLRASFLKPTSKNIQAAINKAKQVECFKTTF